MGTFAVQIAKAFGARVTGVCSTGNVDMVRSIGADHVIDYREENFTITAPLLSRFVSETLTVYLAQPNTADLIVLRDLINARSVMPVIDRRFPLKHVPQAIGYLEGGHAERESRHRRCLTCKFMHH